MLMLLFFIREKKLKKEEGTIKGKDITKTNVDDKISVTKINFN